MNAQSESDLPRNREQAQNQRRGISSKQVDSLILMLMNSKRQQLGSPENAFIREVTGPELRVVLGFNWQLRDSKVLYQLHKVLCTWSRSHI